MASNVAAGLAYLFGFVSGIIFLLIEKRDSFVRFATLRSILLSAVYLLFWIVYMVVAGVLVAARLWFIVFPPGSLVRLAFLALWLWVTIRDFQGHKMSLPVIGDLVAERYSRSV